MDVKNLVSQYKDAGLTPFPLVANTKIPPKGVSLVDVDKTYPFSQDCNIGLFMGGDINFAVIDADNDMTKVYVLNTLNNIGLLSWITIVSTPNKNGYHFWLKLSDMPQSTQAYYKIPATIGMGEFRVKRPSYVVAPYSSVDAGIYKFVQGDIEYFKNQPTIKWSELDWLIPYNILMHSSNNVSTETPKKFTKWTGLFIEKPSVLKVLAELSDAEKGSRIERVSIKTGQKIGGAFPSRSEAEFNVIMSLLLCGWNYDKIYKAFNYYKPRHFVETPNPDLYLLRSYNRAVDILSR